MDNYFYWSYLWDKTNPVTSNLRWDKTNLVISNLKISKEEKKMHKKRKIKGHVAHKMTFGEHTYFYIVAPERESVEVYAEWQQPPIEYVQVDSVHITPRILGRHGYLQSVLKRINEYLSIDAEVSKHMSDVYDFSSAANKKRFEKWESALGICHDENNNTSKEEKKMGETVKARITLNASEDCYLEVFSKSNTILFHFGTESREVTVPDDYEIDWGIKEPGTCDLQIVKKKPKLLNMKFTVKARPIFIQKYANTANDICDSAISFPEPYAGDPLHLVIKDGLVSTLSSDSELLAYEVGIWILNHLSYTVNDIPLIERKIREAYNTRKIFPNATNGIEIIKEER